MTNNAIMNGFLKDLLDILDARAVVYVFSSETNSLIASTKVYKLLADDEFMQTYGRDYKVVGLTLGMSTSIMITKERF